MLRRTLPLLAILAVSPPATAARAPSYDQFDSVAQAVRAEDDIPGLSVAIVDHDRVIVRAYGTREIHRDLPVTTRTAFGYGSTAKAFVALAATILQEQGALTLNDRIRDHLPAFEVEDPYVSSHATLLDALSHRTGLARDDFVWFGDPAAPFTTVLARMQHLPQRHSFRGGFEYSNLMYGVAEHVIERAAGMPVDRFLEQRVFEPPGMRDAMMSRAKYEHIVDFATAHAESADGVLPLPRKAGAFGYESTSAPFVGSAADGAKWLQFLLDTRPRGSQQVISREALEATWHRITPIPDKGGPLQQVLFGDSDEVSYAQGWFVSDYRGHRALTHLGGADGMGALVSFMPEEKVGIVVLANLGGSMARAMLRNWVFDRALGLDGADQPARYRTWKAAVLGPLREQAQARDRQRLAGARSPLPLQAYAGRYVSPLYGTATVVVNGDGLQATFNSRPPVALKHWHDTTFELVWELANYNWPLKTLAAFRLDPDGRPESLLMDGGGEQAEFLWAAP